ncbi:hypothetical protein IAG44_14375 [Streptomyces roseirectus]|uniref:Glycosyltransferase n=1 Tax=Streptomyces roseirectus TaxID=2768066 RepID=A0A7H0ICJ4_9ACTN|nr:hypothetical protein [Streptomyces roseirectus]QNP70510.1 hypothetical protein IAG44_14375 [Streptomyces roseirectus]
MSGPLLVLVEPHAHRIGGHHQHALTALASAYDNVLVVAPYGSRSAAVTPTGRFPSLLMAMARAVRRLAEAGKWLFTSRRWPTWLRRLPHQVTLLARCLAEAACVRTAHSAADGAVVVVLSASEALHSAVGLLGGPHLRFVHEVVTTEGILVRTVGALTASGGRRVLLLAPTNAVRDELAACFPRLRIRTRPFALVDPEEQLTDAERQRARNAFGIRDAEPAVCLVGGWWPYKDISVVDAALVRLDCPLHVIVAGDPLDSGILWRWSSLPHVRLHTVGVPESVRSVYAAVDAAVVARRPGVGKESGLVVDAVRFGVPLLLSDHDPALTDRLSGQGWTRTFPVGDGGRLAALLSDLARTPLPRPAPDTARHLGVPSAAGQAAFLLRIASSLKGTS